MANEEVPPQMVQQVLNCQYQEWHPRFKSLSFRSEILSLPKAFVSYLLDDGGVFLPETSEALPKRYREGPLSAVDNEEYRRWGEGDESEEEEEHFEAKVPSFPDLEQAIDAAIARLGGSVVPKLNWSCPKDTAWVSPSGGVRCSNAAEVILLLKSSDVIVHDLCHAFDNCSDGGLSSPQRFVLVLKKWYPLRPEMEFRCFVKGNHLLGICQREVTSFYPSVLEARDELRPVLEAFMEQEVIGHFPDPDFVCDVYVTSDRRVKIMDFNPYGGNTLPLLFSWSDFESSGASDGGAAETSQRPDSEANRAFELGHAKTCEHLEEVAPPRGSKMCRHLEEASPSRDEESKAPGAGLRVSLSRRGSPRVQTPRERQAEASVSDREAEGVSEIKQGPVEFRVIESATGVMPSMTIAGGAPFDLVDLSSGGAIDDFVRRHSDTSDPS